MTLSPARRWMLFALVLTAGVLNYVDRQIISILKPSIAGELGWDDTRYGALGLWFQWSSAAAFLVTGWLVDRLGVRWANPIGVAAWSLSAMAHGWATSFRSFVVCRIALGATEAMGTPNQVKTVATIFPPSLRSTGFGFTNAVGSIGAVVTPLVIPALAAVWGWRAAFVGAGAIGLAWSLAWIAATRGVTFAAPEPAVAPEPDHVVADYSSIVRDRRTWAITVAKVLSDATWWLMLFWMPDFFHRQFGLEGTGLGAPLAIAYAGSAGHQGFSTTLFSLITDVTPTAKVGRVTSFAAFFGNVGGGVIQYVAGAVLKAGLGYAPLFAFASVSYLLALGWIQLLLPRIQGTARPRGAALAMGH